MWVVVALAISGCKRSQAPAPAEAAEAGMSPSQVVGAVNRARTAGHFDALQRSLVPGVSADHLQVILAVDQVVAASAALQASVAERYGPAIAAQFDLSDMGESYGVFSLHVQVIRERVEGERATVTIQEGENVPLREVALRRHEGCWLVAMEPPEAGLVEKLQRLSRTLDQMRAQFEQPSGTFEDLADSFRLRVWPQLEAIGGEKP